MNDHHAITQLPETYWQDEIDRKNAAIHEMRTLAGQLYSVRGEDELTATICQKIKDVAEGETGDGYL